MYLSTKLTYTMVTTIIIVCLYINTHVYLYFRLSEIISQIRVALKKTGNFEDFRKFAEDEFVLPKS